MTASASLEIAHITAENAYNTAVQISGGSPDSNIKNMPVPKRPKANIFEWPKRSLKLPNREAKNAVAMPAVQNTENIVAKTGRVRADVKPQQYVPVLYLVASLFQVIP